MTATSSNARQPAPPRADWPHHGLAELWRRGAAVLCDDGFPRDASSWRRIALRLSALGGLALLGAIGGALVAVAGLNALYLCAALIGCVFILRDFRIGVVLLILLLPVSRSIVFPHSMLGITGLNPFNLLAGRDARLVPAHGLFRRQPASLHAAPAALVVYSCRSSLPARCSRHVGDIARPGSTCTACSSFAHAAGYLRDRVMKPLFIVIFALLFGARGVEVRKAGKIPDPHADLDLGDGLDGHRVRIRVGVGSTAGAQRVAATPWSALGLPQRSGRLYGVLPTRCCCFTWPRPRAGLRLARWLRWGWWGCAGAHVLARRLLGFIVVTRCSCPGGAMQRTLIIAGVLRRSLFFSCPPHLRSCCGPGLKRAQRDHRRAPRDSGCRSRPNPARPGITQWPSVRCSGPTSCACRPGGDRHRATHPHKLPGTRPRHGAGRPDSPLPYSPTSGRASAH